jgi:hypothetical protein
MKNINIKSRDYKSNAATKMILYSPMSGGLEEFTKIQNIPKLYPFGDVKDSPKKLLTSYIKS